MNRAGVVAAFQLLGLVQLEEKNGTLLGRTEGRYDAFVIRVFVPYEGRTQLTINGKKSDAKDKLTAVRHFLQVLRGW